jgi:hydroxymethylpyrimidine pyrophosphatase-like HAD family hydrolase
MKAKVPQLIFGGKKNAKGFTFSKIFSVNGKLVRFAHKNEKIFAMTLDKSLLKKVDEETFVVKQSALEKIAEIATETEYLNQTGEKVAQSGKNIGKKIKKVVETEPVNIHGRQMLLVVEYVEIGNNEPFVAVNRYSPEEEIEETDVKIQNLNLDDVE